MDVAIFQARSIREREAKASLVNELLTSMSKKSGPAFSARLRPGNAARSLALVLVHRPRRLRRTAAIRNLIRETNLTDTISSCRFL